MIGDDYEDRAKALLAALEQPGPGLLVHPYLGRVMVVPSDDVSVHTRTGKLRCVEVTFAALESIAPAPQDVRADAAKRSAVLRAGDAMRQDAARQFAASWDLRGVSEFVRVANVASVTNVMANLAKINNTISAALSVPGTIAHELDTISLQITQLLDTPDQLIASLQAAIAVTYQALARVAGELGGDVLLEGDEPTAHVTPLLLRLEATSVAALTSDLTAGETPISTRDTEQRARQRANFSALQQAANATAIAEIATTSASVAWPSAADNTRLRDALIKSLDAVLMLELSPDLVDSTEATRSSVWRRFTRVGTTLTVYTPLTELPASVIAYELYGDATRSEEIVERNAIANPCAVPGGVAIQVLAS
jgi:prophage DNA circulation protein